MPAHGFSMIRTLFLVLISVSSTCNLLAGEVGLVLSGGGAKGFAHIGVIRALEENNIPINYITGTSMGAIIGAMYASGYSPDEMESIIDSDEFRTWSTGRIPVKYSYYYKNSHLDAKMFSFAFEMKDSLTIPVFPTNLIPTHSMDLGLLELFISSSAAARNDFDSLFIPFRCVASDIHNNTGIVLKNGDLSSAVRASMAYPFVFNPVEIDNVLLFDGGIHNNFPFDVMINEFHPAIIIGSKTSANPPAPTTENLRVQLHNMIVAKTDYDLEAAGGILIDSDVPDIGLLEFQNYKQIINIGYEAAIGKIDEIKNRVESRIKYEVLTERRQNYKKMLPPLVFRNVFVNSTNNQHVDYVINSIRQQEDYFTIDRLRTEYYKLVSDDNISSIYPRAEFNDSTGSFDLYLDLKSETKLEISLGGNISSTSLNQGFAGMEYKVLGRNAYKMLGNIYFGRLYNSAMAKGKIEIPGEFPLYGDVGLTFNRFDYFTTSGGAFFDDLRPSYLIRYDGSFKINAGAPIGVRSLATFGYSVGRITDRYYQTENFLQSDTADRTDFDLNTITFNYESQTLNRRQYATRGNNTSINLQFVRGNEKFTPGSTSALEAYKNNDHMFFRATAGYTGFYPVSPILALGFSGKVVLSSQSLFNNYTASLLHSPSYKPFPHSNSLFLDNYRAHSYAGIGLIPVFQFNESLHLRLEAHLFQPYEKIGKDGFNRPLYMNRLNHRHFLGSAAMVYHTPVGPASLSLNYYEKSGQRFYFLFNFGYLIFNQGAM